MISLEEIPRSKNTRSESMTLSFQDPCVIWQIIFKRIILTYMDACIDKWVFSLDFLLALDYKTIFFKGSSFFFLS